MITEIVSCPKQALLFCEPTMQGARAKSFRCLSQIESDNAAFLQVFRGYPKNGGSYGLLEPELSSQKSCFDSLQPGGESRSGMQCNAIKVLRKSTTAGYDCGDGVFLVKGSSSGAGGRMVAFYQSVCITC